MSDARSPHRDLAGALHDVSNELTVLLGWVAEARAAGANAENVAYALGVIEQRAQLARDLARRAVDDAYVDERREIFAIVDEVARAMAMEGRRAGTRIVVSSVKTPASGTTKPHEGCPKVSGSLDLSQILTNLLMNALAYAPCGTTVDLSVDVSDDVCTVLVSDEGPGVERSRHESIFNGDSRRPGGTGIGLRHSRALARSRGGEIDLVERGDRSTSFRVRWPRADKIPRAPSSVARLGDLQGLRLLLVEDDLAVVHLLEVSLEARGAVVSVVTERAAFDEALSRSTFDGFLVDASPLANDLAGSIAAMRANAPQASLVLMTGNADVLATIPASPTIELVRKPFEVHELVAAILRGRSTKCVDEGHE